MDPICLVSTAQSVGGGGGGVKVWGNVSLADFEL